MYFDIAKEKFKKLKTKENVIVLSIESSCDETSIAVVKNGREVLSNIVASQIEIHRLYGGVVPEIASRNHISAISNVYKQALSEANITESEIDAVAVTYGAGLVGALMVGVNFAKALAYALEIPLIAVSHIKGHISANYITEQNLEPPFVCLMISGGHTALLNITSYTTHELLGTTIDDAVGEAFDKVARVLGLPYPGGPEVDKLAKLGENNISFLNHAPLSGSLNFSFSGIKTAVINYVHNKQQKNEEIKKEDVCASFQNLVANELVNKSMLACKQTGLKKLVIAGGVSANSMVREKMKEEGQKNGIDVYFPSLKYCTDNAAMIGSAGYYLIRNGEGLADLSLTASPTVPL